MVTWFDGTKGGMSPITAPGAVMSDDRQPTSASRYPPPATADLVTLWKRNGRVVMSVTSGGKVQDFHMAPSRLVYLIREIAEQLAENAIIQ